MVRFQWILLERFYLIDNGGAKMVTFKENYDVRVEDETPVSSGMFTFLKGRSYDAVYRKQDGCTYLFIYSFDHKVSVMFNKIDEKRFLR